MNLYLYLGSLPSCLSLNGIQLSLPRNKMSLRDIARQTLGYNLRLATLQVL